MRRARRGEPDRLRSAALSPRKRGRFPRPIRPPPPWPRRGGAAQRRNLAILGSAADGLVNSGDPVAEKEARERLASSYDDAHRLETQGGDKAVIVLGKEEWPYPIPLVKQGAGWRFDVAAGAQQIIDRRIGRDELNAIEVCHAYVEAQREYAAKDRLGDGLHEYARRVASAMDKRDGLYWRIARGEEESPLGPLVAAAEAEGFGAASAEGRAPFHGYYYRILTRQGKSAPGGAQDYLVKGHLTGGLRAGRVPRDIRQFRRDDLHRQPERRRLPEEPRPEHGLYRAPHERIRSGYNLAPRRAVTAARLRRCLGERRASCGSS